MNSQLFKKLKPKIHYKALIDVLNKHFFAIDSFTLH